MDKKDAKEGRRGPKRFLGIYFRCCNVYGRIYKNNAETAYEGKCPKCGMQAIVQIGKHGTSSRFFEAI